MKLGVLARTEQARGIAIQTREFIEHMPVDRILKIRVPNTHGPLHDPWPDSPWAVMEQGELPEAHVRHFLAGLDVLFTVETVYDWRLIQWAREVGCKVVIQGNPEFYRHGRGGTAPTDKQQPYEWWWPTMWRHGLIPDGPYMPVPMPARPFTPPSFERLQVLHVVGHRASKDRNGTEVFLQAIRNTTEPLDVWVHGIDEQLPEVVPQPNVNWNLLPNASEDRWALYADKDVLVLPRRYGGNCLPALEAEACGLAVMMPDTSPNDEHAQILTGVTAHELASLPAGMVNIAIPDPYSIARCLDQLAIDRHKLAGYQHLAYDTVPRWSAWAPRYLTRLENLCSS